MKNTLVLSMMVIFASCLCFATSDPFSFSQLTAQVVEATTTSHFLQKTEDEPKTFVTCTEEPVVTAEGFTVSLAITAPNLKVYSMTVERSLLTGLKIEHYRVLDKTSSQTEGSPTLYQGIIVLLTIQNSSPTRPDGRRLGHFTRRLGGNNDEERDVLCTYL